MEGPPLEEASSEIQKPKGRIFVSTFREMKEFPVTYFLSTYLETWDMPHTSLLFKSIGLPGLWKVFPGIGL